MFSGSKVINLCAPENEFRKRRMGCHHDSRLTFDAVSLEEAWIGEEVKIIVAALCVSRGCRVSRGTRQHQILLVLLV